jgi:hypothetical protein
MTSHVAVWRRGDGFSLLPKMAGKSAAACFTLGFWHSTIFSLPHCLFRERENNKKNQAFNHVAVDGGSGQWHWWR